MFSVMMGLLVGVASQPMVRPAPPMVILTPPSYSAPLPPMPEGAEPAVRAASGQPLPQLFSTADYPAAARRNDEQGTVAFAIAIDPAGRVTACSITESSGSASLDRTTCSILQRRARFTPARDATGRAVEDRSKGRVRWVLPPQPPIPFTDHRMALVFTIDATGGVTACRIEATIERPADHRLCPSMMNKARSIAAEAAKMVAITNRELVLEEGVLVGRSDAARSVGRGPGETRGLLTALVLDVDAAGTITRCVAADETMNGRRTDEGCKDSVKRKFAPLDTAGDQSERHAVRYRATYTRPID